MDQRCDTGHQAWFFAFKHCYISLYIICDNIGGYLKTTLIKEYLLSNQVIEEPVKKWQNVGGANTLVKISFHKQIILYGKIDLFTDTAAILN